MPSEAARLVLGYLRETNCPSTESQFLHESVNLTEYSQCLKNGQRYTTMMEGYSLSEILKTFYILTHLSECPEKEIGSFADRFLSILPTLQRIIKRHEVKSLQNMLVSKGKGVVKPYRRSTTYVAKRLSQLASKSKLQSFKEPTVNCIDVGGTKTVETSSTQVIDNHSSAIEKVSVCHSHSQTETNNHWCVTNILRTCPTTDSESQTDDLESHETTFIGYSHPPQNMQFGHAARLNSRISIEDSSLRCSPNLTTQFVNVARNSTGSDKIHSPIAHGGYYSNVQPSTSTPLSRHCDTNNRNHMQFNANRSNANQVQFIDKHSNSNQVQFNDNRLNSKNLQSNPIVLASEPIAVALPLSNGCSTKTIDASSKAGCSSTTVFDVTISRDIQTSSTGWNSETSAGRCAVTIDTSTCKSSETVCASIKKKTIGLDIPTGTSVCSSGTPLRIEVNSKECQIAMEKAKLLQTPVKNSFPFSIHSPLNFLRNSPSSLFGSSNFHSMKKKDLELQSSVLSSHDDVTPINSVQPELPSLNPAFDSPRYILSQQRSQMASLTTPVKEFDPVDNSFCSPRRKNVIPRRRLLGCSPSTPSPRAKNIQDSLLSSNASTPQSSTSQDELPNYGAMLEELINYTPLIEKLTENINQAVYIDKSLESESDTKKKEEEQQKTFDCNLSDSLIKDIIEKTESDPVFADMLNLIFDNGKPETSHDGLDDTMHEDDLSVSVTSENIAGTVTTNSEPSCKKAKILENSDQSLTEISTISTATDINKNKDPSSLMSKSNETASAAKETPPGTPANVYLQICKPDDINSTTAGAKDISSSNVYLQICEPDILNAANNAAKVAPSQVYVQLCTPDVSNIISESSANPNSETSANPNSETVAPGNTLKMPTSSRTESKLNPYTPFDSNEFGTCVRVLDQPIMSTMTNMLPSHSSGNTINTLVVNATTVTPVKIAFPDLHFISLANSSPVLGVPQVVVKRNTENLGTVSQAFTGNYVTLNNKSQKAVVKKLQPFRPLPRFKKSLTQHNVNSPNSANGDVVIMNPGDLKVNKARKLGQEQFVHVRTLQFDIENKVTAENDQRISVMKDTNYVSKANLVKRSASKIVVSKPTKTDMVKLPVSVAKTDVIAVLENPKDASHQGKEALSTINMKGLHLLTQSSKAKPTNVTKTINKTPTDPFTATRTGIGIEKTRTKPKSIQHAVKKSLLKKQENSNGNPSGKDDKEVAATLVSLATSTVQKNEKGKKLTSVISEIKANQGIKRKSNGDKKTKHKLLETMDVDKFLEIIHPSNQP